MQWSEQAICNWGTIRLIFLQDGFVLSSPCSHPSPNPQNCMSTVLTFLILISPLSIHSVLQPQDHTIMSISYSIISSSSSFPSQHMPRAVAGATSVQNRVLRSPASPQAGTRVANLCQRGRSQVLSATAGGCLKSRLASICLGSLPGPPSRHHTHPPRYPKGWSPRF